VVQEDQVLTIADVAKRLQVSEKTISRMLQEGTIPGFKVANQWRFHPTDFERWLLDKRTERDGSARRGIATMLSGELESIPISRLTTEKLIIPDIHGDSKEEVLSLMTRSLADMGIVDRPEKFVSGLLARERMMTTGVGGGIALPHLRNPEDQPVDRPYLVVGISPNGIEWDSIDGKPVNLILLPVTGNEVLHVRTLAAIRRMLIIDGVIDMLTEASSPQDAMSVLIKIETIQQELNKEV